MATQAQTRPSRQSRTQDIWQSGPLQRAELHSVGCCKKMQEIRRTSNQFESGLHPADYVPQVIHLHLNNSSLLSVSCRTFDLSPSPLDHQQSNLAVWPSPKVGWQGDGRWIAHVESSLAILPQERFMIGKWLLDILSAQSISLQMMLKETRGNAVVMFKQLHHLTPVGRSRWQDPRRVIHLRNQQLSPACQDGLLHIQIVQRCLHGLASPDSIVQLARVSSTSCLASICVNAIQYHSLPFHHVIHIWCIQRTILSFRDIARAQIMYDTYIRVTNNL